MKYICTYISGSGKEWTDGEWKLIKHTEKYRTFKRLTQNIYISAHLPQNIGDTFKVKNEDSEGTFSIYPRQAGVPHIFEAIK